MSLNRYTYGWANPLTYWDPDGRFVTSGPLIDGVFGSRAALDKQIAADVRAKGVRRAKVQRQAQERRIRRISEEAFGAPTPRRDVQLVVFDINAIYIPTTSSEEARNAEQVWLNRNNFVAPVLGLPQDQNLAGGGACEAAPATVYQTRDDQPQAQPELLLFGVSLRCSVRTNVVIPTEAGLLVVPRALIEMFGDGSGGGGPTGSRKSLLQQIDEGITEWLARPSKAAQTNEVLPTPRVSNGKLQNIINNLYKGTTNPNRVGTGTTADAVRNEVLTGNPTAGLFHTQKAVNESDALRKLLAKGDLSFTDRVIAQFLLDDLTDALSLLK